MSRRILVAAAALSALTLGACASTSVPTNNAVTASAMPTEQPVTYVRGSAPFEIPSMMQPGFDCLSQEFTQRATPIRIGVSRITDTTGKISYEAAQGGTIVTQGGSEMVISALGNINGVRQVQRLDTSILTVELEMAKQRLLRQDGAEGNVLPLYSGQYLPTDYYISGSITSAEGNIRSGGSGVTINGIGYTGRYFIMSITTDLALTDSRTGEIVSTSSGTKQIKGYETNTGSFTFFGDYLVDIQLGEKNQEGLQLGVRTALEYDLVKMLPFAIQSTEPRRCLDYVNSLFSSEMG